jgi:ketosteroid isomerase-like protein
MREEPLPAVAAVVSFIDAINRGDIARLGELMTDDHHLDVFDELPIRGKAPNIEAWRWYASAFPAYVIYPHRVVGRNNSVAVLGHTTGSHLGLSDDEESRLLLIWRSRVEDGKVACWQLVKDTPKHREQLGLLEP